LSFKKVPQHIFLNNTLHKNETLNNPRILGKSVPSIWFRSWTYLQHRSPRSSINWITLWRRTPTERSIFLMEKKTRFSVSGNLTSIKKPTKWQFLYLPLLTAQLHTIVT